MTFWKWTKMIFKLVGIGVTYFFILFYIIVVSTFLSLSFCFLFLKRVSFFILFFSLSWGGGSFFKSFPFFICLNLNSCRILHHCRFFLSLTLFSRCCFDMIVVVFKTQTNTTKTMFRRNLCLLGLFFLGLGNEIN